MPSYITNDKLLTAIYKQGTLAVELTYSEHQTEIANQYVTLHSARIGIYCWVNGVKGAAEVDLSDPEIRHEYSLMLEAVTHLMPFDNAEQAEAFDRANDEYYMELSHHA